MATQSLARMSITTTPTSARTLLKSSTPKSILKSPTPLPLSPNPFPFSASFSVHLSPSAKSPHVHFAPSPCLTSTYTTHSPNTYDRAPISVSPNPCALPAWGDRVYSPTLNSFKLAAPPKHVPLVDVCRSESPTMTEFEAEVKDPRSPPPSEVHFPVELPKKPSRDPIELSKALTTYPRSPYPSAPLSPVDFEPVASEDLSLRERAASRRALSLDDKKLKRTRRIQSPRIGPTTPFTPIPSPLSRPHLSPVEEHLSATARVSKKPPPLQLGSTGDPANPVSTHVTPPTDSATSLTGETNTTNSAGLSQAFWQSMSLIGTGLLVARPGMTSYERPAFINNEQGESSIRPSTTSSSSSICPDADVDDIVGPTLPGYNNAQPQFMFATRDGVLWSPGLPRKTHPGITTSSATAHESIHETGNLLSPGMGRISLGMDKRNGMTKISRSLVASPSPNDPTANFPSFSAALSDNTSLPGVFPLIKYPPRAQVPEQRQAGNGNHI